ncbi:hypothetical protein TNCV_3674551 [Trichonephila clavipes]|nr:hypothetical protein TNCV_3674551 [Trichonephila clavipes]
MLRGCRPFNKEDQLSIICQGENEHTDSFFVSGRSETFRKYSRMQAQYGDSYLLRAKSTIIQNASKREEVLHVTTKDRADHRHQPIKVVVFESMVMEGMTSIQLRNHIFFKQKGDHRFKLLLVSIDSGAVMLKGVLHPQRIRG